SLARKPVTVMETGSTGEFLLVPGREGGRPVAAQDAVPFPAVTPGLRRWGGPAHRAARAGKMFSRGQQNPAGAAGSPGCPRDRKRSLPARRSAARLRTAAPGEAGLTSREEKTATRR